MKKLTTGGTTIWLLEPTPIVTDRSWNGYVEGLTAYFEDLAAFCGIDVCGPERGPAAVSQQEKRKNETWKT